MESRAHQLAASTAYAGKRSPTFGAGTLACIATVIGLFDALCLLGWHVIDPLSTDWLRSDPTVFQAGWEFLRRQPLTFPFTWIFNLNFPFGISAAYLDVIPIVAVPLKILSPALPQQFQYFGIYLVFCLVLQVYYSFRLISRFTRDKTVIILGGLFFLNAPVLLSRLYIHFSLCSQWLLLAAIYYYFVPAIRKNRFRFMFPFLPLLAIASGVTPYLAVMVLSVGLAALARICVEVRPGEIGRFRQPWLEAMAFGGLMLAIIAGSFLLFGFIVPGENPVFKGDGYTMFSLNLLSPFDRGHFLPGPGYEGFAYLGAGVLLLMAISVARYPVMLARAWATPILPILIMSVILTLLALSARIMIGRYTLVMLPLPTVISDLLATFRGSGRLFWPVYYLLILFAVVAPLTAFSGRITRLALIASALLIQFVDTVPLDAASAEQFRLVGPASRIADLEKIAVHYRHLIVLPAFQCGSATTPGGDAGWPQIARMAARAGLTLNSVHAARISAASRALNCRELPRQVQHGDLQVDAIYVLNDRVAVLAMKHNADTICRRVDGLNVCTLNPVRAAVANKFAHPPCVLGRVVSCEPRGAARHAVKGWRIASHRPFASKVDLQQSIRRPGLGDLRSGRVLAESAPFNVP